ncbi:MAG: hypothetical protein CBB70_12710 [Planctomycetaceae bacterium TMED10]|nr:MAG: hypothetical protein CBB70_12710 [Planctomycetaceae bacterium TMED10]
MAEKTQEKLLETGLADSAFLGSHTAMWSSQFFWKFLLTTAGLNLLAVITFAAMFIRASDRALTEENDNRLQSSAILLRTALRSKINDDDPSQVQDIVRSLGKELGLRITLLTSDGSVLADSFYAQAAAIKDAENQKERLEILRAETAIDGYGRSERVSPTQARPMRYFAIRMGDKESPEGFLRVASPASELDARSREAREKIIFGGVIFSILMLGVCIWFGGRTVTAVKSIDHAIQKITSEGPPVKVYLPDRDEFGVLGDHLNRMSVEMGRRIDRLQGDQARLATVLEGMGEGVITVNDEEKILFANPAAGKLLNFDPQESVGRPLLEAVRNHTLHEAVTETISGQNMGSQELEIGENHDRILRASFTRMQGEPCPGIVIVLNDFTDLRRLELLRQEFIANVSHELKTPLSAIKAYAETLQRGAIEDGVHGKRFVERIGEQAERLHQLILDMLHLARVESGKQAFDIHPIAVSPTVESCVDDFSETTQAKKIAISFDPPDEDLFVQADAEGLRHILSNLIDNAVKYTPENGSITVRWRRDDEFVVIDVVDTGIGIAAKDQDRLFERFFRVDKARSRELGGTGLGLSIVKHLTLDFGGQLGVTSQLGMGSTFTIKLPLAEQGHQSEQMQANLKPLV